MMLHISHVLSSDQLHECRRRLPQAPWQDGRDTAGPSAALVKNNLQLPPDGEDALQLGQLILAALERNPLFMSAALPRRVLTPRFNCHQACQAYGLHVDNAVQRLPNGELLRSDLSATLFLRSPD